ncbi:MAG: ABC transporter substrate-binding protein [Chloroflexi bacterium]|nr:ABC transporter substrate-binding protein [Chloroflexota bacterium]
MATPTYLRLLVATALLLGACTSASSAPTPTVVQPTATTVAAAPAAGVSPTASGLTHVQVALGFVPSVQSAPFYVAQDKGYYAAEGLDVEFKYGTIQDVLSLVSQGDIAFASASGDSLMPQRQQGVAVTYIMTFWNKDPIGALAIAGNNTPPLTTPADLKGKNVGVSAPNSSTDFGLKALLKSANLTEDDIHLVSIGTTEVEALMQKRIDTAMTFLPNEAAQMKSLGLPTETIAVADYMDYVPPGFVSGDTTIQEHPEVVQKFVNATLRGLRDTLADPDTAFESSLQRMPELSPDNQPLQRDVLTATLEYYQPVQGQTVGGTRPQSWQTTQDFLQSIGVVPQTIDPRQYYTNTFVQNATP